MAWKDRYSKPGPGIPKDAPKKKGLALFFDILGRELFELVKLNLLFVLFCIPVVTIPAAITAMSRITMKMVMDENHFLWNDFWESFRKEWKAASLGGWLLLAILAFSVVGMSFYGQATAASRLFLIPLFVSMAVGLVTLISAFYFFPMQSTVDLPLRQTLKNAVLLSFTSPGPNLLAAALHIAAFVFLFIYLFYVLPVLLLFAFSLLNLIATFLAYGGISKYVLRTSEDA